VGKYPGGRDFVLKAFLPHAREKGYAVLGSMINLRVNPNDPEDWVEASDEVKPWWNVLAVPLFGFLPVMVILLGLAELRRRQMLAVWRDGREVDGVVVST